jgi:hypothetical protein
MAKAVAKVEEVHVPAPQPAAEVDSLLNLIERAARDPNVDIDKMERLFGMRERMQAQAAKTAYLAALSKMQSDLPAIERKGTAHNNKRYARFEDFVEAVKPILAKHGFSLSFRINQIGMVTKDGGPIEPAGIRVTGVLGHEAGHHEETSITLPADATGNKNPVQSVGSSVSYGKRYVGVTLLGVATEDEDDDGKAAGGSERISNDQVEELRTLLMDTGSDLARFYAMFEIECLEDMPKSKLQTARQMLAMKKKKAATP